MAFVFNKGRAHKRVPSSEAFRGAEGSVVFLPGKTVEVPDSALAVMLKRPVIKEWFASGALVEVKEQKPDEPQQTLLPSVPPVEPEVPTEVKTELVSEKKSGFGRRR